MVGKREREREIVSKEMYIWVCLGEGLRVRERSRWAWVCLKQRVREYKRNHSLRCA